MWEPPWDSFFHMKYPVPKELEMVSSHIFTWDQRFQLFVDLWGSCAVHCLVVEVRFLVSLHFASRSRLADQFGGDLHFKAMLHKSCFVQHHPHLIVRHLEVAIVNPHFQGFSSVASVQGQLKAKRKKKLVA